MGYCYTLLGKRVCDICDREAPAGKKVIKVRCPFSWCQPYALCPDCRKKHNWKDEKYHPHCQENAAESAKREAENQALLHQGKYLRTAAIGTDNGRVRVLFRNIEGQEKLYIMIKEVYDAFPLGQATTPGDYAAKGEVVEIEGELMGAIL